MALTDLVNVGEKLAEQLKQVGIEDEEALRAVGSREAWLRILAIDDSACIMRLYALEGALTGLRWKYLPDEVKKSLKQFYNEAKH